MKKLEIALGGHPLVADDLEYVQSSLTEGIVALAKMTGESFIAIYGAVYTSGAGTWTAGWILINGELCQVDAGAVADNPNNVWAIIETNDGAGLVQYEDLNMENTYKIRKAHVVAGGGGTYSVANLKKLSDYLAHPITTFNSISSVAAGTWQLPVSGIIPTYRKNKSGNVELHGSLRVTAWSTPTDDVVAYLPVGYRPATNMVFIVYCIVNATPVLKGIQVESSGALRPLGGFTAADAVELFFSGIQFPAGWAGF